MGDFTLLLEVWYKKYRPKDLNSFVFQNPQHKQIFQQFIDQQSVPHLLLSGGAGLGKSAMARILIESLSIERNDIFYMDGSSKNSSVEFIRGPVTEFVSMCPFGSTKIVHIEECDRLSKHAQDALRVVIGDQESDTRFIMTCNHPQRLTESLISRFQHIQFNSLDSEELHVCVATILIKEDIKFDLQVLEDFVTRGYPDARKIINSVQMHSYDKELHLPTSTDATVDIGIENMILQTFQNKQWVELRKVLSAVIQSEDWEALYVMLYNKLHEVKGFEYTNNWEEAIILISDHMYKNVTHSDKEINFTSLMIQLCKLN